MDRSLKISLIATAIAVLTAAQSFGAQKPSAAAAQPFTGLPLVFEPNHGQAPPDIRFVSRRGGLVTAILDDGLLVRPGSGNPLGIRLMGSSPPSSVVGVDPTGGVSNYYRGRDARNWHEGVPHYRRVVINDVYAGVNLVYYGNRGQLEFDFEISPGTAPDKILMAVEGAIDLEATGEGAIRLSTGEGDFQLHRPTVYQWVESERVEIAASFELAHENVLAFEIGAYDETQPLIIDPILEYATFLGGQEDDLIHAATTDADGNAYLTGSTTGFTYPARNGFDLTFDRHMDAVITKLNPEGTAIVFSTFFEATTPKQATPSHSTATATCSSRVRPRSSVGEGLISPPHPEFSMTRSVGTAMAGSRRSVQQGERWSSQHCWAPHEMKSLMPCESMRTGISTSWARPVARL